MTETDALHYWVALHALPGMGPVGFRRLIDRFGSARAAVEESDADTLSEVRGVTRDLADAILGSAAKLDWARKMADTLRGKGVRIIRMTDADYPARLLDLANPPPLLYMVGEITDADARALSMVGTTKPSGKGRAIAEQFAERLAREGVTIVSGYAHGIDAASHRGAFRGGGRSILCLPHGIRHFRGRGDFPPLTELVTRGAIISECPPEEEWSSRAAIARNRIIAALGRGVFVIETRRKGGTMHTVKAAEKLARPLFALRYQDPPESARGNTILIGRGATGVAKFDEIGALLSVFA